MSFFDGIKPESNYESSSMAEPIPANTNCIALIENAAWNEYQGVYKIEITWQIVAPSNHKGRKIFQKLDVKNSDKAKKEKALKMLAAIDMNAGGHLFAAGKSPTDTDLLKALANKIMQIKLQVWEIDGKKGNWVCAVSEKNGDPPASQPVVSIDTNNDIPF
jgi:hypothetical protein